MNQSTPHYSEVTWTPLRIISPGICLFYDSLFRPTTKKNIKTPQLTQGSNAVSVSMPCRHVSLTIQWTAMDKTCAHYDVIKWNFFRVTGPLRGEFACHRCQDLPHKGQWRGALMLTLICAWTNRWAKNGDAGVLRRHRTDYDVTVMTQQELSPWSISRRITHVNHSSSIVWQLPSCAICGMITLSHSIGLLHPTGNID